MTQTLPETVQADLIEMQKRLGQSLRRLALFGSILHKPFSEARDVDIAAFVDGISLAEAKRILDSVQLNHELLICSANGSYGAGDRRSLSGDKYYHVVLLEEKEPNPLFMAINKDRLRTIWPASEAD